MPPAERASSINRKLLPFSEAARWELARTAVEAPFRKLFIDVTEGGGLAKGGPWISANIAHAAADIDPTELATADALQTRRLAAEATRQAAVLLFEYFGWRDSTFLGFVERLATHEGPYRLVLDRLAVNRADARFTPVIEIDESSSLVRVDYSRGGEVVASLTTEVSPLQGDALQGARRGRLSEMSLQYLRKDGSVVLEIPRPTLPA